MFATHAADVLETRLVRRTPAAGDKTAKERIATNETRMAGETQCSSKEQYQTKDWRLNYITRDDAADGQKKPEPRVLLRDLGYFKVSESPGFRFNVRGITEATDPVRMACF